MNDGPLFIVDNSEGGRSGLDYLREWCELARSFDIASGYFEIGSLLALDGDWQKLGGLRILMGDEVTQRTRRALLAAVKQRSEEILDQSLESDKQANPFLVGAEAVAQALASGKIQCRVYNRDKFHAKAYITHGKFDVIGSQALVGSSNFTLPGLTENIELNIKLESSAEVAQLQAWYERHWDDAVDVTADVLRVIERHTEAYQPFDVWARALQELFADHEVSATEWDEHHSRMFPKLDRYQQEAYWALVNIARQHRGALLCDGVGLGKTFVGLMLIERLVLHENRRVVLFAPKSVKDAVWTPELRKYLSHIGGFDGSADFSNLSVFSHTDLTRALEYPGRFERITELADAVIIDEAHHFRNLGKRGDPEAPHERSRYYRLYDLIGDSPTKQVFMLTATPINNSLNDFRHMVELFSRGDDSYFGRTLGVTSLAGRLNGITKALKERVGEDAAIGEVLPEATELLADDALFKGLVVQRSRAYARASQIQETGNAAAFPERQAPKVAEYSIRKTYGRLLDLVDTAFKRDKPLFALPIYYPLAYYIGPDESVDPLEWNRQAQVVSLIRTNFLKRFESSVFAFVLSCDRLLRKLLAFVQVNSETNAEVKRLERWIDQHDELLARVRAQQLEFWADIEPEEDDDDIVPPEMLAKVEKLDREHYDIGEILAETYLDLDQLATLLEECRKFDPKQDDKLKKLIRLLKSKDCDDRKVIVFTEFADTARYIRRELVAADIAGVVELDSGSKLDRATVIRRFAPYYNGLSSQQLVDRGHEEIRVLIATDVLAEGLNLQDATRLVNYDIHWNPVRLMQRIGRVDRRLNLDTEAALVADHPQLKSDRGKVAFWNFLPPDDLDELLSLYQKVSHKTLLISKTLGIEGKKLLKPEDDYAALKEFNAAYEGDATAVEHLHLEYQRLLDAHPGLEQRLRGLPGSVFSGKRQPDGTVIGTFLCYRLPALDTESNEYTLDAGVTRWYLITSAGAILDDTAAIADAIRCDPDAPRVVGSTTASLTADRDKVAKHIKNTHLKQINAPIDAPVPLLVAWLDLSGEA